jgi:hypothetical protein
VGTYNLSNSGSGRCTLAASIPKVLAMLDSVFEGARILHYVTAFAFVEKLGKIRCLEGLDVYSVLDITSLIGNYSL